MTAEEMTERAAREILDVLPDLLDQKYIAATLVDSLIYDILIPPVRNLNMMWGDLFSETKPKKY